jgi:hydrogenase expression/formation protein HypC
MCMTIPSRVVSVDGNVATVECFGVRRTVSTVLMPELVVLGDYVAIMANAYAVEKISPEMAAESLAYLQEVLGEPVVMEDKR